ncbi:uncharacterized protein YegP (UPF0339 family) [Parabacteroides sp. PFB2-10]|nr:YegP family protein [Parabacteroides sp. PFB2-10]MDH6313693.1 uncharacterized protein YegP (UPF0339 family) [Parabacteroides sp. PFB2-10]MDL2244785.1 YegP family protein [Parabacteroides sp. OttesenSCG-928-J18]
MGKFEVTKRKNGEFQFNLKAGNGQVILTSEGYVAKDSCLKGIESVRKNSQIDTRYEIKTSKDNRSYFNLKASNGQVVGTSEMYNSEAAMKNGIESVKKNAPEATLVDLTII